MQFNKNTILNCYIASNIHGKYISGVSVFKSTINPLKLNISCILKSCKVANVFAISIPLLCDLYCIHIYIISGLSQVRCLIQSHTIFYINGVPQCVPFVFRSHISTKIRKKRTDDIQIPSTSTKSPKCPGICPLRICDTMAEWSKALVLGTSLRAWVQIPLVSYFFEIYVIQVRILHRFIKVIRYNIIIIITRSLCKHYRYRTTTLTSRMQCVQGKTTV